MESKRVLASTSLLMVLLASFASIPPTSAQYPKNERYLVMGGILDACTQLGPYPPTLWDTPFQTRYPHITPGVMQLNITFSDRWYHDTYGWIVNLTVPADSFVGVYHEWYDATSDLWYTLTHYMTGGNDGYGYLFLDDAKGDVDCYTFHNDTGAYWGPESPLSGDLAASMGSLPSFGPDTIPGTGDDGDGFGDGVKDAAGASVLVLPSKVRCEWHSGTAWEELFDIAWPIVFTTGTAYGIVDESDSLLDTVNATAAGKPWERLHSGTPWDDEKWNAYVTYGSCWGMLDVYTPDFLPPYLDVFYYLEIYSVREDKVIWGDITMDGVVDSTDDGSFGVAYGALDEFWGNTPASPTYDARCDFNDDNVVDSTDDGTFGVWWGAILLYP